MAFDFGTIKKTWFHGDAVMRKVAAGRKRSLSKIGAFVRQRMRTSIKRRKKSAPPGKPPHAHQGAIKLIFFGYDERTESVVVGPIRVTSPKTQSIGVPPLLEKGGDVSRTVAIPRALSGRVASKRQKDAFRRKVKDGSLVVPAPGKTVKVFHYEGNPFVAPAAEAERPNFPKALRDCMR